jgi:hypothetical protein
MSDLEELVREELRARVAAAEAEHAAESASSLLRGLDRRISVTRLRRRWTGAALSAVAVAAAIALPLTLLARPSALIHSVGGGWHRTVPLSDPSLTPPGWTPLTYRDAQISVPSSWVVQAPLGSVCGVTTPGGVLFGRPYLSVRFSGSRCRLPPTTVFVSTLRQYPRLPPAQRINGIPVTRLPEGRGALSYAVPSLGVEVTAVGPKASRVIATLTRAPRSVALARGPMFAVPPGWRWHEFGGIAFAAPRAWPVKRTREWSNCLSRPVRPGVLTLSTATEFGCHGGLASPTDLAERSPVAGMSVGTGRVAAEGATPGRYWRCIRQHGVRACIPHEGAFTGVFLELILFLPGRPLPTVVDIGLAGTGATTRTILDSIKPR